MVAMAPFFIVLIIHGQTSGERLKDHWSSGLNFVLCNFANVLSRKLS